MEKSFDDIAVLCRWLWDGTDEERTVRLRIDGRPADIFMDGNGKLWESRQYGYAPVDAGPDALLKMVAELKETMRGDGKTAWERISFDVSARKAIESAETKERSGVSCPGLPGVPQSVARKFGFPADAVEDFLEWGLDDSCSINGLEMILNGMPVPESERRDASEACIDIFGGPDTWRKPGFLNERQMNVIFFSGNISPELARIGIMLADAASSRADPERLLRDLAEMAEKPSQPKAADGKRPRP